MYDGIVNDTRYDNSRKPMKQTNFTNKKSWEQTFSKENPLQ